VAESKLSQKKRKKRENTKEPAQKKKEGLPVKNCGRAPERRRKSGKANR